MSGSPGDDSTGFGMSIPKDVLRAVFLKWEIEARATPANFSTRAQTEKMPPDQVADKLVDRFIRYANEMGVNHS